MKTLIHLVFILLFCCQLSFAQGADPILNSGGFSPITIEEGQLSTLTIDFGNNSFATIPANSFTLSISTANNFYTSDGVNPSYLKTLKQGSVFEKSTWFICIFYGKHILIKFDHGSSFKMLEI